MLLPSAQPGYRSSTGTSECTKCPEKSAATAFSIFVIIVIVVVMITMFYFVLRTDAQLWKEVVEADLNKRKAKAHRVSLSHS